METVTKQAQVFDPRIGLCLLLLANIIAFRQKVFQVEFGWICILLVIMICYRCYAMAIKWLLVFGGVLCLQSYVLPNAPQLVATSFSIFAHYTRQMLPCLMVGSLMIKRTPLRYLIVGLRTLRVPQKLIIALSVTLRYFPAIWEEMGYVRDAMRLREVRGGKKVECLIVPLMVSATNTAEELSAAAVTRGIENPVPKTSVLRLRMTPLDWLCLWAGILFALGTFLW